MRIAIIAPGNRRGTQPCLAQGRRPKRVGHELRPVTHQDFEGLVEPKGVEFWPAKGKAQDIAQSQDMRALLERGNLLTILSRMAKEAQHSALARATGGLVACRGLDLVIAGIGGVFMGIALAEKLGLPLLQARCIPFTPARTYPSYIAPRLPPGLGRALNRPSYHLARQTMWQGFRWAGPQPAVPEL